MFGRILRQLRVAIASGDYIVTPHADEEIEDDDLSIFDVENAVMEGAIAARQREPQTGGWKYRVHGPAIDGRDLGVVLRLGPTGKAVIITAFVREEE